MYKCFPEGRQWPAKCERCLKHKPHPLECSAPTESKKTRGPSKKNMAKPHTVPQLGMSTSDTKIYDFSDSYRSKSRHTSSNLNLETKSPSRDSDDDASDSDSDANAWAKPTAQIKSEPKREIKIDTKSMPERGAVFKYQPLQPDEFRILRLHPGRKDDKIVCSFTTRSINKLKSLPGDEPYATISYYWGAEEQGSETEKVVIDLEATSNSSRPLPWPIKKNLWLALRSLRHSTKPRLFWVDALCIDYTVLQVAENTEKTSQTQLKHDIFKGAINLCFWLGDDENLKLAFSFISKLLEMVGRISELISDPTYIFEWLAFINLMKNNAFSRLWLLQEVAISQRRSVTIHAGNISRNYLDFVDAVGIFTSCRPNLAANVLKHHALHHNALDDPKISLTERFVNVTTHALRKPRREMDGEAKGLLSLEELVSQLVNFGCGEPRDRVFSMLALAKDETSGLEISYSKSIVEVYVDFVYHATISSRSLNIICRHWATPDLHLPSWIQTSPSLPSKIQGRNTADSLVGLPGRSHYDACKAKPFPGTVDSSVKNRGSLQASGFVLDQVAKLGDWASQGIILGQWLDLGGCNTSDGGSIPEDFWRTLVANLDPNGCEPPAWYPRALGFCIGRSSARGNIDTEKLLLEVDDPLITEFLKRVQSVIWNRKFLVSKQLQLVGLVPRETQLGDTICILYGCSVPVVLRKSENTLHWNFIGECYVHGMMNGEAMDVTSSDEVFDLR